MRITNNIITQNAIRTLSRNSQEVDRAQRQVSTGLRVEIMSDDPTAGADIVNTQQSLRALTQYRRNVQSAQGRSAQEEGVLGSLTEILTRAKEIAISQANSSSSTANNMTAKAEVDQLLQQAIQLGNTKFGEEYLFGGTNTGGQPFALVSTPGQDLAFSTTSPVGARTIDIAAGQSMVATHDGSQLFGSTTNGALASLRDLATALRLGDPQGIAQSVGAIDSALDNTNNLTGELGARSNQLQVTGANLDAFENTLKTFKSNLSEIDTEKAITELVGRQTAFQAAMLATSKVMGMNLTDYLR